MSKLICGMSVTPKYLQAGLPRPRMGPGVILSEGPFHPGPLQKKFFLNNLYVGFRILLVRTHAVIEGNWRVIHLFLHADSLNPFHLNVCGHTPVFIYIITVIVIM